MSRYKATIRNAGKPVSRQGHSQYGISSHTAGSSSGIEVQARADGSVDVFEVYATDGYRTSQSRYARTPIGTYRADTGWVPYAPLACPDCGAEIWDGPHGSKLAKCWNYHESTGGTLAFDTMGD